MSEEAKTEQPQPPKVTGKRSSRDEDEIKTETKPKKQCLDNTVHSGKVVIIGSGVIGRNWAVLFARGGFDVELYDNDESQLQGAMEDITKHKLAMLKSNDMLLGKSEEYVLGKIKTNSDLTNALTNAIWIQEGVPENLEIKQNVFKQCADILEKIGNKECVLSSSASTFIPSKLNIKLSDFYKKRLLVCHPVNPPMAIPVVEIVPSNMTDYEIILFAKQILKQIGMQPILMKKEANGFIINRLQYAILAECYRLFEDGIANAQDIDFAVSKGLGLRWSFMGPFETIHLNAPKGVNDYCDRYYNPCLKPILKEMDHEREWKKETWNKIHNEISEKVPVNSLNDRWKWRDNRLMELATLKTKQENKDKE